jgi:hypothetical protein
LIGLACDVRFTSEAKDSMGKAAGHLENSINVSLLRPGWFPCQAVLTSAVVDFRAQIRRILSWTDRLSIANRDDDLELSVNCGGVRAALRGLRESGNGSFDDCLAMSSQVASIPPPPNNWSSRIPRPMDLILIPLQPNQPPTRRAHTQKRGETAQNHSQDGMPEPTAWNYHHPKPARCQHDQEDR